MAARDSLLIASLLAGALVLQAGIARADDDDDDRTGPGAVHEVESIETENIFGYTLGTDTGEKGEKEINFTLDGRLGKLGGDYKAYSGEVEVEYAITDNLKFSLGGAVAGFNIRNVYGFEDTSTGGLGGAFFELKYRFLDHRTSPIGLSLSIEPEWSRLDETSGEATTAYGIEFRLAADAELIKDYLFAAVNIVYQPEWEREDREFEIEDVGEFTSRYWAAGSGLEISGALTAQVVKDVFLGGEVRYLAAYDGATFGSQQGWGLFVGPTLYAQITETAYVKAVWSIQVAGSPGEPFWNSSLDLVNFERQQGRLQVGFQF
ncbi:hypothetical protein K9U40_15415 [Xanthobacter autotrophicus]|uniref:hypothetical protein n=1 Tax=Xanthobacter TaxID=279 RepID=UPI0024ABDBBA|nr:hypothetical protein [Xanthobacter autotrophicus]MDI4665699.1 hypothetical protein [Xanthobacter autotrophicus]